ncbi:hybrid sensor histidine kinase/response regulator [Anoxybacteroides rupiense]|uniref:hybrid sensor histidine kinase/response regulator n=1 Tax=Anoxybacteroides rupiense TaxID=311460 RepID=UPI001606544A|nr:ATP-binding protein [Anoxybacillus rupiensis]MBB3907791.1 sensor histidine kinase YesM [Anoxybacillus rupiensis]
MSKRKIAFILSVFLLIIIMIRFLWMSAFTIPDHPTAERGVLDLRGWEPLKEHSLPLDGEWEFFPNQWLITKQGKSVVSSKEVQWIRVPGNWRTSTENGQVFGYGSYRLRILLDPHQEAIYGIHIPSISSSAEVYVNGKLLSQAGIPASEKESYQPRTTPQTVYFPVNHATKIELIIQVANYDHSFRAGILQSVHLGLLEPLSQEIQFNTTVAIITCVIYLFHALYSLIVFLIGNRNKTFLYFSLMILCIVNGTLIGNGLLFQWVPLSFEWSIKITLLTMVAGGYTLLKCIQHFLPDKLQTKVPPLYYLLCTITVLMIFSFPISIHLTWQWYYIFMMLIPCLLAPLALYRATTRINDDNIFLFLAIIAAVGSLIWFVVIFIFSIEMKSYPFDLMIAMICFSTYWFKQYFRTFSESQELTKKLQKADKQKDEFLTSVAHEMRNPLHGMINISQAVLENEKAHLRANSAKHLELMVSIGRHMSTLLDALLDLERLKENRIKMKRRLLSLYDVTETVLDMIRFLTDEQSIRLVNRVPANLPPVFADENRVIQILFNLLHNAVKYAQADEVSVHASIQGDWVNVSVVDTGIGIHETLLDTIFERYTQGNAESAAMENGVGLGLHICKQLVELHGGTLTVHSTPGQGSVFTFSLELANTEHPKEEKVQDSTKIPVLSKTDTAKQQQALDKSLPNQGSVRILAVDDDPINLRILEIIFSEAPYHVVSVTSSQEALALVESEEWDVVIADVMMPYMSGYELTRMIRQRASNFELPILLLTARSHPEDIVAGFLAGANDYVTKPIEGLELKARVNTLIHLKQSIHERLRMEAALLQAQIHPHFLFNTIDTIASLSTIDHDRMIHLLVEFGNYLRKSFDSENFQKLVPLEHELELLRSYLYIQKERFGDRLTIDWDIDQHLHVLIPPLIIQPLVENAIRHGILQRIHGGTVQIRIIDQGKHVEVTIADNGVGMTEEEIRKILHTTCQTKGIGIYNTNWRLKQLFGEELHIKSTPGEGTTIFFKIPKT